MDAALFALLGWIGGLLSALILDWNKNQRTARAVMQAVRNELRELSNRYAHVVYNLALRTESLDTEHLQWLQETHGRYRGAKRNDQFIANLAVLAANPEQAARDAALLRAQRPLAAPGLKKYPTPALDAALQVLGELRHSEQTALLELRTELAVFDTLVDDSREFLRMTFESLDEENMVTVNRNLDTCYRQALQVARRIADLAGQLD